MSAFTTRRLILAAVAALVALAVAGCGGSSGSKSAATVSLSSSMADMTAAEGGMEGMSESEMEAKSEGSEPEVVEGPTGMLMEASSAEGHASLEQDGDKLTGTITVSGLEPGSDHAEHLHGPDGTCEPKKMVSNMAVVLPDLKANSKGVATTSFEFTVHQQVVEPGYFIMVHEEGTPAAERNQIGAAPASPAFMQALSKNPGILCGDVEVKH
jgi:CHRD domain